jgi:hypothetical protein
MNEQAKVTLEVVIEMLDKFVPPERPRGHFKAEADRLKSDERDHLESFLLSAQLLSAACEGLLQSVGKTVLGENILTPSLTNKGWKFWRRPLVTESEQEAIKSAFVRLSEAFVTEIAAINHRFENLPNRDDLAAAVTLAEILDARFSYVQQLSAELKAILRKAQSQ